MAFEDPAEREHIARVIDSEKNHKGRKQGTRGKQVTRAYKRRVVMEFRAAGMTFEQIAEQAKQLGIKITTGGARQIVRRMLDELQAVDQESLESARQLDLQRLDQIMQALWPKARQGDVKAIREFRGCIDQRSRLLGTYAATKHEFHGRIEGVIGPDDREEIERLREAFLASGTETVDVIDSDAVEDALPALAE